MKLRLLRGHLMGHEMSFFRQEIEKTNLLSFWTYGKVPVTIFIVAIILFVISIIITYFTIPIPLLGIIFTPILTSLLVILIDIHNSKIKNEFILELLLDEISHDLMILYENEYHLKQEHQYLKDELYSTTSLYPLKLDIWKYSISNLTINPFNKFTGLYNSFIYEAIRYNENINFRTNINPIIYQKNFIKTRKKNNKTLLELGEYATEKLIKVLETMGDISIIKSEYIKNQDDLINQLKKDGIPPKNMNKVMNNVVNILEEENFYIILYSY